MLQVLWPLAQILITSCFSLDINECLRIQSSCNGTCHNTNGSYHCSCPAGYFYDTEERTCAGMILILCDLLSSY